MTMKLFTIFVFLAGAVMAAEPQFSDVFTAGKDGYVSIRIPSVVGAGMSERGKEIQTGFEGERIYRTLLVSSDDDGLTWTAPQEVTRGTKHETGATTIATGPGIGIQLTRGAHKGRIVMPFNEGPYTI